MSRALPQSTQYLTLEEAAARLRKTPRWLRGFVKKYPYCKKAGRTLLFTEDDLKRLAQVGSRYIPKPPRQHRSPQQAGFIYFIEVEGFVKIGWSGDWTKRLPHIKTASPFPVAVLAVTAGTPDDETALHARFAAARHHGEWFRRTPELASHIESLAP